MDLRMSIAGYHDVRFNRRDVDNRGSRLRTTRPCPGLQHRHGRLAHQEWAGRVDREDLVPLFAREFCEGARPDDTGIVDKHIKATELARNSIHGLPHGSLVCHIDGNRERARELASQVLQRIRDDVHDRDGGPFAQKCLGNGLPVS